MKKKNDPWPWIDDSVSTRELLLAEMVSGILRPASFWARNDLSWGNSMVTKDIYDGMMEWEASAEQRRESKLGYYRHLLAELGWTDPEEIEKTALRWMLLENEEWREMSDRWNEMIERQLKGK